MVDKPYSVTYLLTGPPEAGPEVAGPEEWAEAQLAGPGQGPGAGAELQAQSPLQTPHWLQVCRDLFYCQLKSHSDAIFNAMQ